MRVDVAYDADAQGEPVLGRLRPGPRVVEVVEVLDRWFETNHAYVNLITADGTSNVLRHDRAGGPLESGYVQRRRAVRCLFRHQLRRGAVTVTILLSC